jgi:hypothetical protein
VTRLVLLPSPLLGPATWAPVATELRRRKHAVLVAAPDGPVRSPDDVLAGLLAVIPDEPDLVLVPHSNSGLYVAALARRRDVCGLVFVDAGLPCAGPSTPVAPDGLVGHLADLAAVGGLLPPWTEWWPAPSVRELFPDDEVRVAVEGEQRRLPLAYFRGRVPSPPGWERLPASYLAFGDTYAAERDDAARRGWPVETLPGRHLHQLVAPGAVADALERLLAGHRDRHSHRNRSAEPDEPCKAPPTAGPSGRRRGAD